MGTTIEASLTISYNGKNATEDILSCLSQMTYTDVASGETDTISLVLADEKQKWINAWFPLEGDYIEATINQLNWTKPGDNKKLKCGKFLIDDYDFKGPPDSFHLNAISCPIDTEFASTKKSKTWNKTSVKGIASGIAKNTGIKLVYDAPDYKIEKQEQSDQDDMRFLFSVCENYGLAMKLFNSKLIIFSEADYEKKKAIGTLDKSDCDTYELNGTLVGVYHGVSMKYTDSKTNKTLSYSYYESKGNRLLKVNEKADSYADAEIKAKAKLRKANREARTLILDLKGDTSYVAGTCYNITGFGKFNGKYYIDKVTHTFSDGYMVSLQMHRVLSY